MLSFFYKNFLILFDKDQYIKVFFLIFGMLLMAFFEVIGIASVAPFIAIISNQNLINENYFLNIIFLYFQFTSNENFIIFMGISCAILLSISNFITAIVMSYISRFAWVQGHIVSKKLLISYLNKSYYYFLTVNSSQLNKNILTETQRLVEGYVLPIMQAIARSIVVIFIFIFLLYVNVTISISLMFMLLFSYYIIFKSIKNKVKKIGTLSTKMVFERYKYVNDSIFGIRDLILNNNKEKYIKKFNDPSYRYAIYQSQSQIISLLPRYFLETIAFAGMILIVIFLILQGLNVSTIIPIISIYALSGYRLFPSLQNIYYGFINANYTKKIFDIIVKDLDKYISIEKKTNDNFELPFQKFIELNDITFRYNKNDTSILKSLNFKISKNTSIGIVGKSGSGKTTLINILLGLLHPSQGIITLDSIKIDSTNINLFHRKIGYVPQFPYLTDDTFRNNITFGIKEDEINQNQLIKASKEAEIYDFIMSQPYGFDTIIGERGLQLSGGQQQRIAIARALYNDPSILIFDEATSSLDLITESKIMQSINKFKSKKTIITIAHRIQTLKNYDIIYILDKGEIVDSGSYKKLFNENTYFRKLTQN